MKKPRIVSRADAVAAIGYDGDAALVDGSARRLYEGLSTADLAERGFFRAATISALSSASPDGELGLVARVYNERAKASYAPEALPRLFGVARVTASRTLVL